MLLASKKTSQETRCVPGVVSPFGLDTMGPRTLYSVAGKEFIIGNVTGGKVIGAAATRGLVEGGAQAVGGKVTGGPDDLGIIAP